MTTDLAAQDPPLPRFVWLAILGIMLAAVWAGRGDFGAGASPTPSATLKPLAERSLPQGGADLFVAAGCSGCHVTVGSSTELGPSLAGALAHARIRLLDPGYAGSATTAEEYLAEATVDHCRDVLPGYRCDEVPDYGVALTAEAVASLVTFLAGLPEGVDDG